MTLTWRLYVISSRGRGVCPWPGFREEQTEEGAPELKRELYLRTKIGWCCTCSRPLWRPGWCQVGLQQTWLKTFSSTLVHVTKIGSLIQFQKDNHNSITTFHSLLPPLGFRCKICRLHHTLLSCISCLSSSEKIWFVVIQIVLWW